MEKEAISEGEEERAAIQTAFQAHASSPLPLPLDAATILLDASLWCYYDA
jgi:hypothetical protein